MHRFFHETRQLLSTLRLMLVAIWQAYPAGLLLMFSIQIVQGLLPLGTAWVTKWLFDELAMDIAVRHIQLNIPPEIFLLLICLAVSTALQQLVMPLNQYLGGELGRRLSLSIQTRIYQKVTDFSGLAYFEDSTLHNTIQIAANGARSGPSLLLRALMTLLTGIVTLISFLGVLIAFNAGLAVIIILSTIPQFFIQWKLSKQRFGVVSGNSPGERLATYYGQVMSAASFAKEVRLFNLGNYFLEAFTRTTRTIQAAQRKQQQQEAAWQILCAVLSSLVGSAAFIFVFIQAFRGLLSFGDVSLYMNAVGSIEGALLSFIFTSASINEQALFFREYTNLLAMRQPLPLTSHPRMVPTLRDALELHNVSFRYSEKHPWVLRHVNLRIPAGKCLALVGLNGAGKTTLVKLLTRMYDPTEGKILWDGIDIREFDPLMLRQHIAAIFQDFMRYDITVRENIGLGDVERIGDIAAIQQAARQAGIAETITQLPQGYDTQLSRWLGTKHTEPGVDLSGGQWQKIALARMFMRQADMLMLDEPTAALDAESEYSLYCRFSELMTGHTSLIITHRFSTVRMADAIAVLQDGSIIEYGPHHMLLASNGTYAHLYRMQAEQYDIPVAETRDWSVQPQ